MAQTAPGPTPPTDVRDLWRRARSRVNDHGAASASSSANYSTMLKQFFGGKLSTDAASIRAAPETEAETDDQDKDKDAISKRSRQESVEDDPDPDPKTRQHTHLDPHQDSHADDAETNGHAKGDDVIDADKRVAHNAKKRRRTAPSVADPQSNQGTTPVPASPADETTAA
jgi:hypothetical protein